MSKIVIALESTSAGTPKVVELWKARLTSIGAKGIRLESSDKKSIVFSVQAPWNVRHNKDAVSGFSISPGPKASTLTVAIAFDKE